MATEIRTITDTWCDVCLLGSDESQRVVSTWSGIIAFDRVRRQLDLCETHQKELIGDLPEVLEQCGTKLDPATAARVNASPKAVDEGVHICPRCNVQVSSRGSLTAHARNVHNKPLAVLEQELGLPQSGGSRRAPAMLSCPECGKQIAGHAGLGSHMRTHKDKPQPALLKRTG